MSEAGEPVPIGMWRKKGGALVSVTDLAEPHLLNALHLLRARARERARDKDVDPLKSFVLDYDDPNFMAKLKRLEVILDGSGVVDFTSYLSPKYHELMKEAARRNILDKLGWISVDPRDRNRRLNGVQLPRGYDAACNRCAMGALERRANVLGMSLSIRSAKGWYETGVFVYQDRDPSVAFSGHAGRANPAPLAAHEEGSATRWVAWFEQLPRECQC